MKNLFREIISIKSDISSNRFLGVYIFTPALLFLMFFKYPIEYVYALIGLITALLVSNTVSKFANGGQIREDNSQDEVG